MPIIPKKRRVSKIRLIGGMLKAFGEINTHELWEQLPVTNTIELLKKDAMYTKIMSEPPVKIKTWFKDWTGAIKKFAKPLYLKD